MQDPILMTMLVLAVIVVVTFTVLSLVYPTEKVATIALAKRMQYESLACSPLGEPIDEITSIDAEVIDVVEKHNAILSNDDQDEFEW
tara:strand:+ start:527 stop:787 length:261 start_codon:yes stop_codon:yes gene_type:complete